MITGTANVDGRTVFVFPGQGAQWAGMGRELLDSSPVFAARLHECSAALTPYVDWDLIEVISSGGALDDVDVVQPVSWAIMVSLAALWRSLGVEPDAVIGHSQGEIAAAAAAGWLSLEDAAKIVALRSQLIDQELAGHGGMMSIALPAHDIDLSSYQGRLWIAAINGPTATVVAGDTNALKELQTQYGDTTRTRIIPVDYASHTGHVDKIATQLNRTLADITPRTGDIPWLSTVTGQWITNTNADYWFRNLRHTVHFADAVTTLLNQGHRTFIEVSTHPVLNPAIQETIETNTELHTVTVSTLRRNEGSLQQILTGLAELHVRGIHINWTQVLPTAQRVPLPTYAFQHQRYW
ncbi:acyltransferase domain-containing protein, partial [Amycolatopsis sp. NPDC051061]|uniref:acyltransferase domain-containing protein n=1 Tax=Amycolatopsis sp. NPDC051061 TaxID=3155042 RepID=UPI003418637C